MTRALKLTSAGRLRLSEADVTEQCLDFLRVEGWTCIRQHVGKFIPLADKDKDDPTVITIGEKGDPDWLVFKVYSSRLAYLFFLELKRPGGRLRPDQKLKHIALRQAGWLVCVASGRDQLWEWMAKNGLAREPDRRMFVRRGTGWRYEVRK